MMGYERVYFRKRLSERLIFGEQSAGPVLVLKGVPQYGSADTRVVEAILIAVYFQLLRLRVSCGQQSEKCQCAQEDPHQRTLPFASRTGKGGLFQIGKFRCSKAFLAPSPKL